MCDEEVRVIVGLEAEKLQIMLHLDVESFDIEGIDAFDNIRVNGAVLVGDGE